MTTLSIYKHSPSYFHGALIIWKQVLKRKIQVDSINIKQLKAILEVFVEKGGVYFLKLKLPGGRIAKKCILAFNSFGEIVITEGKL